MDVSISCVFQLVLFLYAQLTPGLMTTNIMVLFVPLMKLWGGPDAQPVNLVHEVYSRSTRLSVLCCYTMRWFFLVSRSVWHRVLTQTFVCDWCRNVLVAFASSILSVLFQFWSLTFPTPPHCQRGPPPTTIVARLCSSRCKCPM